MLQMVENIKTFFANQSTNNLFIIQRNPENSELRDDASSVFRVNKSSELYCC